MTLVEELLVSTPLGSLVAEAEAVLERLGQLAEELVAVTCAWADGLPSLSEREVAELDTVPQVAAVVALVMWTWKVAAAAMSTGPKLNTPAVLVQVPVVPPASMDQLRPVLVGRVSETLTLRAMPAPPLVTVRT